MPTPTMNEDEEPDPDKEFEKIWHYGDDEILQEIQSNWPAYVDDDDEDERRDD
jgi:hypothetical protein